ncbi:unnamed protein product [Rhizophagus irregularis]|nr:unnamed protein product [Rhizophagus irregularis]CAB4411340.1 unnamed protein product [Rhizophagus irregularis]
MSDSLRSKSRIISWRKRKEAANGSSSDTSSSDTEHNKTNKTPQKRTRITSKVDMDEDFTANTAVADMGLDTFTFQPIVLIPAGPSSPDGTVQNSQSQNTSTNSANVSMYNPANKEPASLYG